MSKLVDGRIPANTVCPFRISYEIATAGQCHHLGDMHYNAFSCATARGFDLIERNAEQVSYSPQKGPCDS